MGDNSDWKMIVWRKLNNIVLDYPEFGFLFKIVGGLLGIGIVYLLMKIFLLR